MSSGIFEFQLGHCIWSQLTSIIPVLIILQQNWGFQPAFPDPMSDPKHRPPTAAEVVGRLKDDGDFDALRRAIVRKVKDNVSFPQTFNPPNPLPQGFAISLFLVPNPARWNFDAYMPLIFTKFSGGLLIAVTWLGTVLIVCKRLESVARRLGFLRHFVRLVPYKPIEVTSLCRDHFRLIPGWGWNRFLRLVVLFPLVESCCRTLMALKVLDTGVCYGRNHFH